MALRRRPGHGCADAVCSAPAKTRRQPASGSIALCREARSASAPNLPYRSRHGDCNGPTIACRLYSLLAYIVACIYTPRLISANTPHPSRPAALTQPIQRRPHSGAHTSRVVLCRMKYPPRPSVHTGHEGHACSTASPMSSKPIKPKHGVSANHAPSTAATHTALPLAAAAAGAPTLRDACRGPSGGALPTRGWASLPHITAGCARHQPPPPPPPSASRRAAARY